MNGLGISGPVGTPATGVTIAVEGIPATAARGAPVFPSSLNAPSPGNAIDIRVGSRGVQAGERVAVSAAQKLLKFISRRGIWGVAIAAAVGTIAFLFSRDSKPSSSVGEVAQDNSKPGTNTPHDNASQAQPSRAASTGDGDQKVQIGSAVTTGQVSTSKSETVRRNARPLPGSQTKQEEKEMIRDAARVGGVRKSVAREIIRVYVESEAPSYPGEPLTVNGAAEKANVQLEEAACVLLVYTRWVGLNRRFGARDRQIMMNDPRHVQGQDPYRLGAGLWHWRTSQRINAARLAQMQQTPVPDADLERAAAVGGISAEVARSLVDSYRVRELTYDQDPLSVGQVAELFKIDLDQAMRVLTSVREHLATSILNLSKHDKKTVAAYAAETSVQAATTKFMSHPVTIHKWMLDFITPIAKPISVGQESPPEGLSSLAASGWMRVDELSQYGVTGFGTRRLPRLPTADAQDSAQFENESDDDDFEESFKELEFRDDHWPARVQNDDEDLSDVIRQRVDQQLWEAPDWALLPDDQNAFSRNYFGLPTEEFNPAHTDFPHAEDAERAPPSLSRATPLHRISHPPAMPIDPRAAGAPNLIAPASPGWTEYWDPIFADLDQTPADQIVQKLIDISIRHGGTPSPDALVRSARYNCPSVKDKLRMFYSTHKQLSEDLSPDEAAAAARRFADAPHILWPLISWQIAVQTQHSPVTIAERWRTLRRYFAGSTPEQFEQIARAQASYAQKGRSQTNDDYEALLRDIANIESLPEAERHHIMGKFLTRYQVTISYLETLSRFVRNSDPLRESLGLPPRQRN